MTQTDHAGGGLPHDVLHLGGILDLKAASALYLELLHLRGRDLILDASDGSRVGGLCLQVLFSAIIAWRADGRMLATINPSDAFVRALDLFGVGRAAHQELLA